ncbi:sialate O-acetylesterase [Chitinophaga rhizophila]|uniref:Sialate O-acetylesterase n=1 Tax=Chitinophaga rhizophila TaxID=2866212 RepID=A0ABS7GAM6_9BACT|nr:sialate O-acetylesterase [Chitinophaga rhizophila]MBW8684330.1 sialate O-acetylesterase [Chitinophaga rhizophila]
MQLTTLLKPVLTGVLSCALVINSYADVRLPSLVGSNMVLQRNKPLNVWGWADKGEKVTVSFRNGTYSAVTAADGKWKVQLPAQQAGGPYTMTVSGHNTIKLENILVGEVWIASGQSNMEMPLKGWGKILNYEQEIKAADYPEIRLFQLKHTTSTAPLEDANAWDGGWQACTPQSIPEFSSVGYFFAREIYSHQHVPVGVIHTSWGGTVAEAWTSGESIRKIPAFADTVKAFETLPAPQAPANPNKPTLLYNGMIHPLLSYAFRGVIWYQGEGNANRAYQYREVFPTMIKDWRKHFNNGNFPFYFVQLANFKEKQSQPMESDWAELREAQLMTLSLPNTGMATAVDIGDAKDIHPKNKQEVGRRLSLIARAKVYGEKIPFSGPIYQSKKVAGNKVTLTFKHVDNGLKTKEGNILKGFEVAGADKKFHPAEATIKGNMVIVTSKDVDKPVAVRYGWADNPDGNLYNGAGLPASPFRTDNYQGITYGKF